MNIYFITGNKGKFEELNALIPNLLQKDIDLPEIQEIDPQIIIEAKLREALKQTNGSCIVEDTSVYIESLHGLPGPLIKWFLKALGNDGLAALASSKNTSTAVVKTVIGFARNKNKTHFFNGELKGSIVPPRGTNGFGWDSIFQPEGSNKTFGEMTPQEKSTFSMRRIAGLELQRFLSAQTK